MSRIGRAPIPIPAGVEVKINGSSVEIKGPKGKLARNIHPNISLKLEDKVLTVVRPDDSKQSRALHGLTRALLNNMVVGVVEGFRKELQINGVGYRAEMKGKDLVLSLGYSHPCQVDSVDGISFEVGHKGALAVTGIDKEMVGQVAANIRSLRKVEPYKGKGIRYVNEVVIKKLGKTAGSK